jgi:uncharacterized cupredoxin-like copper-binding protein
MKRITLLFILLTGLPILAACSAGGATGNTPLSQAITLVATDIAYDAERIEVGAGQTIRLTLDNQGVLEHDFNITGIPLSGEATVTEAAGEMAGHDMGHDDMGHAADEPAVHVAAPGGDQAGVEFVPTSPGEYEFYCTVSGHREAGMHGVLVVK